MVSAIRLLFSLLILISTLLIFLDPFYGSGRIDPGAAYISNFFSYFTVQSNLLIAIWFLAASIYAINGDRDKISFWNNSLTSRGGLLIYGTITAVVYWTMLAASFHSKSPAGYFGVIILHSAAPLLLLTDLLAVPFKGKVKFRITFLWLLYPLLYGVFTFIRGALVNWYPYFFLDPVKTAPFSKLALTLAVLIAGFYLSGLLVYGVYSGIGKKTSEHKR